MRPARILFCAFLFVGAGQLGAAPAGAGDLSDPTGLWKGPQGNLALALAGDTLAFSYVSVFGEAAHICEGGGVAVRAGEGRYEYEDEEGTVAFLIGQEGVRLEMAEGIPSFCGANWPGEKFPREGFTPPRSCAITAARAYFHTPGPLPPLRGRAYVVAGDPVEVMPVDQTGENGWVLARFKGPKRATVGLLRETDLACK